MSSGPGTLPSINPPPEIEAEARRQVIGRVAAALQDTVPPEEAETVAVRVLAAANQPVKLTVNQQTAFTEIRHSGNIPHPQLVADYDHVLPGSAERLFKMAETDQNAVIASNKRDQYMDVFFKATSLLAGVFGLGSILFVIVRLAEGNHDGVAAAVAGMGAAGIITAFVNARFEKKPAQQQLQPPATVTPTDETRLADTHLLSAALPYS